MAERTYCGLTLGELDVYPDPRAVPYLVARIRKLEAGLDKYGKHKHTCGLVRHVDTGFRFSGNHVEVEIAERKCTCGLAELMGGGQ